MNTDEHEFDRLKEQKDAITNKRDHSRRFWTEDHPHLTRLSEHLCQLAGSDITKAPVLATEQMAELEKCHRYWFEKSEQLTASLATSRAEAERLKGELGIQPNWHRVVQGMLWVYETICKQCDVQGRCADIDLIEKAVASTRNILLITKP